MTHAARYSIIRFLPYAETEEFANVGVVMFAPTARYFDFRLSNKWRRLGAFFDTLDRRVFAEGVRAFNEELVRTRETAGKLAGGGALGQVSAERVFEDLVRPREALFRFSSVRAVMTEAPEAKLAALFDHYVEHDFATHEYQEALIERAVRGVLRREGLGERFRPAKLGAGTLQFAVPFAERDTAGHVHRIIKPMHLAYDDPVRILDHGNQWLGRLRHLDRVKALPEAMLFAVTEPPVDTERHAAFEEVRRDLETLGAKFAASNDEQAVLGFARAA
jgi:hypothetical protein